MDVLMLAEDKTVEGYVNSLPENKRVEIVRGKVYDMAPPLIRHQRISRNLSRILDKYIESKNGNCEVLYAPFGVFFDESEKTYFEPDIAVICDKSKLTEKGCIGSPELVIEILSPSSIKKDLQVKPTVYEELGAEEYWTIDPSTRVVTVFNFKSDTILYYLNGTDIPVGIYDDCCIKSEELWKGVD